MFDNATQRQVDLVFNDFQPVEDAYSGTTSEEVAEKYTELENAQVAVCQTAEMVCALDWFTKRSRCTPMQKTYKENPWKWRYAIYKLYEQHLHREAQKEYQRRLMEILSTPPEELTVPITVTGIDQNGNRVEETIMMPDTPTKAQFRAIDHIGRKVE